MTVRPVAWHGDACLPLAEPFVQKVDVPAADNGVEGQTNQAIWVDIYVPKGTPAGEYAGKATVAAEGLAQPVEMNVALKVLPLSLPDDSSWIVELNSYGGLAGLAGVGGKDPEKIRQAEWGILSPVQAAPPDDQRPAVQAERPCGRGHSEDGDRRGQRQDRRLVRL